MMALNQLTMFLISLTQLLSNMQICKQYKN
nr:MAG TPA: hypothetical protein [Caudoviricetes sp.]